MSDAMTKLIGTWRLVATEVSPDAKPPIAKPYGPLPQGVVSFGLDGRMHAALCDGRPENHSGAAREYNSYIGAFTFDGDRLVTRVDGSSNPAWVGGDQHRRVRFDGDRMTLLNGDRILHWERVGRPAS